MPRLIEDPELQRFLDVRERRPKLVFTVDVNVFEKLSLSVSHDHPEPGHTRQVFGNSGRDATILEMPEEWWAVVLPAVVAKMSPEVAAECLKRIHERLGQMTAEEVASAGST